MSIFDVPPLKFTTTQTVEEWTNQLAHESISPNDVRINVLTDYNGTLKLHQWILSKNLKSLALSILKDTTGKFALLNKFHDDPNIQAICKYKLEQAARTEFEENSTIKNICDKSKVMPDRNIGNEYLDYSS
jgi:hypothetical protein